MVASGAFDILNGLTEWLGDLSTRWWFVLVVLARALLDSIAPIVPSESTVIIGGVDDHLYGCRRRILRRLNRLYIG